MSNNRGYIIVKVTYPNKEAEEVSAMDIYDAKGKKVNFG